VVITYLTIILLLSCGVVVHLIYVDFRVISLLVNLHTIHLRLNYDDDDDDDDDLESGLCS